MSERERLLKKISALDFAIMEFHIFLDTHPNNNEIENKLDEYIRKSDALRVEYEQKYGPITANTIHSNRVRWISNPWPWDNTDEGGIV